MHFCSKESSCLPYILLFVPEGILVISKIRFDAAVLVFYFYVNLRGCCCYYVLKLICILSTIVLLPKKEFMANELIVANMLSAS